MQKNSAIAHLVSTSGNVLIKKSGILKNYFFFLFLGLSGCATFSPSASLPGFSTEQLSAIHSFKVEGSLSASNAAGHGGVAYFQWLQTPTQWKISIFGPFGINRTEITGTPQGVLLTNPHYAFSAPSSELLLQKTLGIKAPVPQLNYWLRGLPDPALSYTPLFDASHRVSGFTQESWQVSYLSRMHYKNFTLPQSMMITDGENKLRLSITRWQF